MPKISKKPSLRIPINRNVAVSLLMSRLPQLPRLLSRRLRNDSNYLKFCKVGIFKIKNLLNLLKSTAIVICFLFRYTFEHVFNIAGGTHNTHKSTHR